MDKCQLVGLSEISYYPYLNAGSRNFFYIFSHSFQKRINVLHGVCIVYDQQEQFTDLF